jgi:hypothetical protein
MTIARALIEIYLEAQGCHQRIITSQAISGINYLHSQ